MSYESQVCHTPCRPPGDVQATTILISCEGLFLSDQQLKLSPPSAPSSHFIIIFSFFFTLYHDCLLFLVFLFSHFSFLLHFSTCPPSLPSVLLPTTGLYYLLGNLHFFFSHCLLFLLVLLLLLIHLLQPCHQLVIIVPPHACSLTRSVNKINLKTPYIVGTPVLMATG